VEGDKKCKEGVEERDKEGDLGVVWGESERSENR
jgi:hypothetical protein